MTSFLIYELKVAILITVFYVCWRWLLANQTCHRQNRMVLIGSAIASFVLPLCRITIHKTVDVSEEMEAAPIVENQVPDAYPVWMLVLTAIFIIGVLVVMAKMLFSLWQLQEMKRPSEIHPMSEGHELAVCETASQPFSWWKTVFLNRKDFEEGTTALLTHELGHIRLRHSLDVVIMELCTALQWFNPAMWMLRRDLRILHEYEADQQVLSHGFNDIQYLNLLIRMAASRGGYSLANGISNQSTLKKRIAMITKKKSNRWQWLRLAYLLPIIVVSLYASAETKVDYQDQENQAITFKVKDGKDCLGIKAPAGSFFSWLVNGHLAERGVVKEDGRWNVRNYFSVEDYVIKLDGKEVTKGNIPQVPIDSIKELKFLQGEQPRIIELYTSYVSGFNRTETIEWPEQYKNNVKRWMFFYVEDAATGKQLSGAEVDVEETGQKAFTNDEGWCEMKIALGTTVKTSYQGYEPQTIKVDKISGNEIVGQTFWMNKPGAKIYIYKEVDTQPVFSGNLDNWIAEHAQLSESARNKGLHSVLVWAVINEDGSISGVRLRQGVRKDLNDEAIRLVSAMPKWEAAKKDGKAVKCLCLINVRFNNLN